MQAFFSQQQSRSIHMRRYAVFRRRLGITQRLRLTQQKEMYMNTSTNYSIGLKWSMALFLSASLAACGGGGRDPILGSGSGSGGGDEGGVGVVPPTADAVLLGSASSYGIFGGSAGMTNTGDQTVIVRSDGAAADIGTTATANSAITGFHDAAGDIYTEVPGVNVGNVTGSIRTCTNSTTGPTSAGTNAVACTAANDALADALVAYNALDAMPPGPNAGAGNLANLTLAPGVYTSAAGSFKMEGGDLTLDAQGDPDAVWVFQMATTLTVGGPGAAAPQSVILAGGAQAKNVYWQVGSAATINAAGGGTMVGTIISQAGVAISTAGNTTPVTLNGRALSLGASVTVVNTVINVPAP
jgi:hypothetical protein